MKKLLLIGMFSLIFSNNAHALSASWDRNPEPDVYGYKVYLCSSYDKASRLEADIHGPQLVVNPCFCCDEDCQVDLDLHWDDHDFVFIAVTAIAQENESEPTIAYFLYGNIYDTYNDGTPHDEAALDSSDFAVLATSFGKTDVTHQQINCDEEFSVIITTLTQRCDIDRDGDVDILDLVEFAERSENTFD